MLHLPGMHPRRITLDRYADHALPERDSRSVSEHLIGCTRCRQAVADTRSFARLLTEDRSAPAPALLLEAALARRAAGERLILPVTDSSPRPFVPARTAALAAGVLLLVAGAALLSGRNARAADEGGTLEFANATPVPGQVISVEYHASDRFAGDSVLFLRARAIRERRDLAPEFQTRRPTVTRTRMRAGPDGVFRGRMTFPLDAVQLYIVVEDSAGNRIDTHSGTYWELLAHDTRGRPSYRARLSVAEGGRGWDVRHTAARALVADYPDSIDAWRILAFSARLARGGGDSATTAALRRALERFDASARSIPHADAKMLGDFLWLSVTLQDTARSNYWRQRLVAEAPRSPLAVQERAVMAIGDGRGDAKALPRSLARLEALWHDVGPAHPTFLTMALQWAIRSEDAAAIERWGTRYLGVVTDSSGAFAWIGRELAKHPTSREEGLKMLRAALRSRDPLNDADRGLGQSAQERSHEIDEQHAWILQYLGEGLLAEGRRGAALDTLRRSAQTGWNIERFRSVAVASLSAADTSTAAEMLSLVALDPETSPVFADTARNMLGGLTQQGWHALVVGAEPVMQRQVLSMSVNRALHGARVHLTSADGERYSLTELTEGRPTVVVFGLTLDGSSPVNSADMARLQRRLAAQNAGLIAIGLRRRAEEARHLRATRSFNVYFDEQREAASAFSAYGFPMYFVMDARGMLRFAYSEPAEVLAQVKVLAREQLLLSAR